MVRITVLPGQHDTVSSDAIGQALWSIDAGASLSFYSAVSYGETISLSNRHQDGTPWGGSSLSVSHAADFHGSIALSYFTPPAGSAPAEQSTVALGVMALPPADSYSLRGDLLKLWHGNTAVDTVRMSVADPYGITVQETAGWAIISTNTATAHGVYTAHGNVPGLPVHAIT